MNTFRRVITTSGLLSLLILTAACGSSTGPEGPFVTPSANVSSGSNAERPAEPLEIPTDAPTADPGSYTDVDLMPFQYDWTQYEVSQEAKDRWGEELATKALPRGLEALEVAYNLQTVWEDGSRTIEDFEAIKEYMSPSMWNEFERVLVTKEGTQADLTSFILYREPNVRMITLDGTKITPNTSAPLVTMTENPRMTVLQDPNFLGDNEHRYVLGGTFEYQFFGKDESGQEHTVTYARDVAIYLVPIGDNWYIDAWYAGDMETVA